MRYFVVHLFARFHCIWFCFRIPFMQVSFVCHFLHRCAIVATLVSYIISIRTKCSLSYIVEYCININFMCDHWPHILYQIVAVRRYNVQLCDCGIKGKKWRKFESNTKEQQHLQQQQVQVKAKNYMQNLESNIRIYSLMCDHHCDTGISNGIELIPLSFLAAKTKRMKRCSSTEPMKTLAKKATDEAVQ